MAAKPEETSTVPTEGAGLFSGPNQEKQPETSTTAEPTHKTDDVEAVDSATAGVADLSVAEKKGEEEKKAETKEEVKEEQKEEPKADDTRAEEKKPEEAPPADTTTPAVAAPPADAPSDAQPAAAPTEATSGPVWPETAPDHPLTKFFDSFEALVASAQHNEVYGIELSASNAFHTKLILQKFLRANQNDVEKAKTQLLETLKWRKAFDPVKAATETYEKTKFDGLGYVLQVEGVPGSLNKKDVATFNIYGSVKDNKATFGDLDGYVVSLSLSQQFLHNTHTHIRETARANQALSQLPPLARRPNGEIDPSALPLERQRPNPQLRRRARPLPRLPSPRLPPSLVYPARPARQGRDKQDD